MTCLACGAENTRKILDFGPQAAANLLSDQPNAAVEKTNLALIYCDACGHAQQDTFYPPERLFKHYLYQSGTTKTLRKYFEWLADRICAALPAGARVLELASNDGSFLAALDASNVSAVGLEPASNLVSISRDRGQEVIEGFWPYRELQEQFDCVVGMNVLAHGPKPLEFLRAVRGALKPGGVACIQVSQADMFENFEFDTLYHEHYSFFCPNSFGEIARRAGFSSSRFCKVAIHGGSIMAILGEDADVVQRMAEALTTGDTFPLGLLDGAMRPSPKVADLFSQRALQTCSSVTALGQLANESSRCFVLVGAAAKAITVLQASGVAFDAVIDEAPLKIGRYIPGTSMQISSFDDVERIPQPCLFLIGAWNFYSEIASKLRGLRGQHEKDLAAVYFPALAISRLSQS